MQESANKSYPHVAVFAFPFASHPFSLISLVRRIATAVPHARFTFFNTAESNAMIFPDGPENVKPYNIPDGVPDGQMLSGNPVEPVELFLKAAPENFKRGVEVAEEEIGRKLTCFMSESFLWFVGNMAAHKGVSWVPLWSGGAFSLAVHVYTDELRQKVGTKVKGNQIGHMQETLDFIPGMSAIRAIDLQEGIVIGDLESPFTQMIHKMGQMIPFATAVVMNSFEVLDPVVTNDLKSKFKKLLPIGLFSLSVTPPQSHMNDPNGCLLWLNKQKASSVAYLSFGTTSNPHPNELVALAEALEASEMPFLWSLRDNFKNNLPQGFLERTSSYGKTVSWAPQMKVLTHTSIGVYITHGGWNSVAESISGGVPMICWPFFADHGLNSRVIENVWEIGLIVKDGIFSKHGTISALEKILKGQEGEKMRENIGKLKELAHKAVAVDGNSTENFKELVSVVATVKDNLIVN